MSDKPTEPVTNEALQTRIDQLEESLKEREHSLLRAIKTFVEDIAAFRAGSRKDFPQAAALGLVFAYLRPRIVIVLGSIGAVIFAGVQVWLLVSQNRLIGQQNIMIESQARSNRMQAVSSLLEGLDNSQPSEVKLAMLGVFGEEGFDVLMELAKRENAAAIAALVRGAPQHSSSQGAEVVQLFVQRYAERLNVYEETSGPLQVTSLDEWSKSEPFRALRLEGVESIASDLQNYLGDAREVDFKDVSPASIGTLIFTIRGIYKRWGVVIDIERGFNSAGVSGAFSTNNGLSIICALLRDEARPKNDSQSQFSVPAKYVVVDLWGSMALVAKSLSDSELSGFDRSEFIDLNLQERCVPARFANDLKTTIPSTEAGKKVVDLAQKLEALSPSVPRAPRYISIE
jgi:hypothetical protein